MSPAKLRLCELSNLQYPIGKVDFPKTLSPEERSAAIDTFPQ
jgi:hypothetical protein